MQVILLERVAKLGQMGDVVDVKPGYARNFLLPQGKAKTASEGQHRPFEAQKAQLEARNLETKKEAEALAEKPGRPAVHRDSLRFGRGRAVRLRHHRATPPMPQPRDGFSVDKKQVALIRTRSRNWACIPSP